MKTEIGNYSIREGRNESRLPELSNEWIEKIRGSADFLGCNYYTSRIAKTLSQPIKETPSFEYDLRQQYEVMPEWKRGKSEWMYLAPSGIGDLLRSHISSSIFFIFVIISCYSKCTGGLKGPTMTRKSS